MMTCTTARTSSTSASTRAARTSANATRTCTLLMENAEVKAKKINLLLNAENTAPCVIFFRRGARVAQWLRGAGKSNK